MKQSLAKKFILIFLLFSFCLPFISPEISLAEDFEDLSLEEINDHLQLPEKYSKKLLSSLTQHFTNQWIDLESSPYSNPEEALVVLLLQKSIKKDILSYFLFDVPFDISEKIIKTAVKIAQLILAQDLYTILDEIERESLNRAIDYGIKRLLENEIQITPGALTLQYLTFSGQKEIIFQYLVIYKPTDSKHGKVEIRFYSPTPIEPPKPTLAFPHEVEGNLPPFLVEVSGFLENFN